MEEELRKLRGHLMDMIEDLEGDKNSQSAEAPKGKGGDDFSLKGFLARVEELEASYAKSKQLGKVLEKSVEEQKKELKGLSEKQKTQQEKLPPLKENLRLSKIKEEDYE